jgi:hypothetical protein
MICGRITASGEYPVSGVWLAGGAALAVMEWWVSFGWWVLCMGGSMLSVLLMVDFSEPRKLLLMALDLVVLWAAMTNRSPAPPSD